MRRLLFTILLLTLLGSCRSAAAPDGARVTLLHFSDYHSHAVPFYSDGDRDAAGISRAVAWLRPRASRRDTLVFSGGDMMNKGAPAWSDAYHCVEWKWFNGVVDAMAFGNHDADYGPDEFARCRTSIDYPILGANVLGSDGRPLFLVDGKPYALFVREGIRIGVFAVAGPDFPKLVGADRAPAAGVRFADPVATAREIVRRLRDEEKSDVVVMIGHEQAEDDVRLARAVPGIDLIFGTHSHLLYGLHRIEGTSTWTVAPS
ncbi:MAG: metallophosphoesterase, partial [Thermoanaerobaculia bacterium]